MKTTNVPMRGCGCYDCRKAREYRAANTGIIIGGFVSVVFNTVLVLTLDLNLGTVLFSGLVLGIGCCSICRHIAISKAKAS